MEAIALSRKNVTLDPIEQSVIKKKVSLPANKIITKEYSPDVKPLVKLMTKQHFQKSLKNINYNPPKVKNPEFEKYGQKFYPLDFLGYKYSEEFDQMVYFRYNNQLFYSYPNTTTDKPTHFFAGLFIPHQTLLSKHFKAEDNIYTALDLSIPQIKDAITQSFTKNSKGCSFDPLFSSNFTSGNMMAAIRKKPFQYDIIIQNDINCKGAEWFNFAVKFIEEGTYTFNIVNLTNENSLYSKGMKIASFSFWQQSLKSDGVDLIKSGNGWRFGGKNVKFFKTDLRKENQLMDQRYNCLSFEFKCKNRQEIVVFANSVPYTNLDYEKFLNRVVINKIGQHMKMEKIQLCHTLAGSPLSAYVFYHRKSKSNTLILKNISEDKILQNFRSSQKHKTLNLSSSTMSSFISQGNLTETPNLNPTKTIVLMARQHPGETPSSFVLEGVIEFLMDNTEFDIFKKNFQFVVIPFVNPDGVKYGNQRVNLAGADLNKCWKNPKQVFEIEVFHIKKFLKNVHQLHPISLMINLSSNCHSLSSYFTSASVKKYCDQLPQIFPYICSKRVAQISFERGQFLASKKQSLVVNLGEEFPKSLVYEFSTSLYGWKHEYGFGKKYRQSNFLSDEEQQITEFTPEIYRNIGREIITTYLEYARLCEKNIGIRDKWIKEIQDLPIISNSTQESHLNQKRYEQAWDRQLIHVDQSLYLPADSTKNHKSQGRKHKSTLQYRFNNSQINQFRSRNKKLTMPSIKNSRLSKQGKSMTQFTSDQVKIPSDQSSQKDSSSNTIFNQFKSSTLTQSVLTPKRKTQILKEISQCIRESSLQKENQILGTQNLNKLPPKIKKIIEGKQKQKKISRMMFEQKNESLVPKTLVLKQEDETPKIKDAIVKFHNIKKTISPAGIKGESSRNKVLERA